MCPIFLDEKAPGYVLSCTMQGIKEFLQVATEYNRGSLDTGDEELHNILAILQLMSQSRKKHLLVSFYARK